MIFKGSLFRFSACVRAQGIVDIMCVHACSASIEMIDSFIRGGLFEKQWWNGTKEKEDANAVRESIIKLYHMKIK